LRCFFARANIPHISPTSIVVFFFEKSPTGPTHRQDNPGRNPGFVTTFGGQIGWLTGFDEQAVLNIARVMIGFSTAY
jgi:hypothetical protein